MKKKIVCIVGPTASGKTALAVSLAKKYNGEIISADSRQVYRGLDIGTGKDLYEYGKIKYHLINIADPEDKFTLFDWLKLARKTIDDISARDKLPIVAGGTGLYVQALVEGFELDKKSNIKNQDDKAKSIKYERAQLEKMSAKKLCYIFSKFKIHNTTLDLNNPHRLIRAIEKAQEKQIPTRKKPDFDILQIGIDFPRKKLYETIDKRIDNRFVNEGMLQEVQGLIDSGINIDWLISLGLEYRIIGIYALSLKFGLNNPKVNKLIKKWKYKTENFSTFNNMSQTLKYKTHAYARRQLTWFRRFKQIEWISKPEEAIALVDNFIKK